MESETEKDSTGLKPPNENGDTRLLVILTVSSLVVLICGNLQYFTLHFSYFPYVSSGVMAHYYIDYFSFGFIKRGLIGSIMGPFGLAPWSGLVRFVAFLIGTVVALTAAGFVYRLRKYFEPGLYDLFGAFVIFSPATILNIGFDLGRFDQLLILCSILALWFISRGDWIKLIAVSVVAVLIHELFLLFFFPILLYTAAFRSELEWKKAGYLLLAVGVVSILLFFFGRIESLTVSQIAEEIEPVDIHFQNFGVIWKQTLAGNFGYSMTYLSKLTGFERISLVAGTVYMGAVLVLTSSLARTNGLDRYGYIVLLLGALPVFLLAIDYSRWFSLLMTNGFIYFIFSVMQKGEVVTITNGQRRAMIVLLVAGLILGPIGVIESFPAFDSLLNMLFDFFID